MPVPIFNVRGIFAIKRVLHHASLLDFTEVVQLSSIIKHCTEHPSCLILLIYFILHNVFSLPREGLSSLTMLLPVPVT